MGKSCPLANLGMMSMDVYNVSTLESESCVHGGVMPPMLAKDSMRKLSLVMIVYANLGMMSVDVRDVSTIRK